MKPLARNEVKLGFIGLGARLRINSMELADNPEADFSAVIRRMEELAHLKTLK